MVETPHSVDFFSAFPESRAVLQLGNGQVVEVPPALIKRLKSHFTSLEGTGEASSQPIPIPIS